MSSNDYFKSLIEVKNNQAVTTSLKVAKVFGKKHRTVIRKIKKLTAQNGAVKNMFAEATYVNSRHQTWPMFYMNKDGFELLAMGFTGNMALQFKVGFIEAFKEMQKQLQKLTNPMRLMKAPKSKLFLVMANQAKKNEKLAHDKRVLIRDKRAFESTKRNVSVSHFAKMLQQNGIHMGRNRLFKWLRGHNYLMSSYIDRNVPYQQYVEQGLFRMTEYPISKNGHRILVQVTRITPKGQQYFMNLFMVGAK